eukprot:Lankesteria_metandrocarpae@DN1956_c0_g1_i1.p1
MVALRVVSTTGSLPTQPTRPSHEHTATARLLKLYAESAKKEIKWRDLPPASKITGESVKALSAWEDKMNLQNASDNITGRRSLSSNDVGQNCEAPQDQKAYDNVTSKSWTVAPLRHRKVFLSLLTPFSSTRQ